MSENIAYAVFDKCNIAVTNRLWQYDYGQKLVISGVDLPDTFEVHFCNRGDSTTTTQLGSDNEVEIPDIYLQKAAWVDAFIYLHATADDGETVYKISIPVQDRPEPEDVEPTPVQQDVITQAIAALNEAVSEAEGIAQGIPTAIDNALEEAKSSGEFDGRDGTDGQDGNAIWLTNVEPSTVTRLGVTFYYYNFSDLSGAAGREPQVGDLVVKSGSFVYAFTDIFGGESGYVNGIGSIKGADANGIWYVKKAPQGGGGTYIWPVANLQGRDVAPAVGDFVFGPQYGSTTPSVLCVVYNVANFQVYCNLVGSMVGPAGADGQDGQDGVSPEVTITEITGGHRVTITDADHPSGQSFDVMDGTGGSSDDFVVTISYNSSTQTYTADKTYAEITAAAAAGKFVWAKSGSTNRAYLYIGEYGAPGAVGFTSLGAGAEILYTITSADVVSYLPYTFGSYSKPSGGIPKSDLASAVQTSLGKADTAYQKPSGGIPATDLASGVIPNVPSASSATPQALGTAAAGSSSDYSRADHVHAKPTASDVGAIPAPASPSSAQDLVYLNGAWVAADKLYIVNCTPTALDYSGTIDKTPAQIEAAIQEGKNLLFRIYTSSTSWYDVPWTRVNYVSGNFTYVSFYFVAQTSSGDMLIFGEIAAGTQTYSTIIYPLSTSLCIPAPASPTTGDFLCWNGSAWVATTVPSAQGVNF